LRQSPRTFFKHLKEKFLDRDNKQSAKDACLFYTAEVICVVYVDDCLFFSPSDEHIEAIFAKMRS
jgi:hypothetical protein